MPFALFIYFTEDFCSRTYPYLEDAYKSIFLCQSTCKRCNEIGVVLPSKCSTETTDVFGEGKTCAIVTGDPCLLNYNFGRLIDSHDVVLRLNMHLCDSPAHCGARTTHMIMNNQHCEVRRGSGTNLNRIHENITVIFKTFMNDWNCFYDKLNGPKLIPCFAEVASSKFNPTFTIDPLFIQSATAAFERLSNVEVRNLISMGFLAMYLLSKTYSRISAFGFCPIEE